MRNTDHEYTCMSAQMRIRAMSRSRYGAALGVRYAHKKTMEEEGVETEDINTPKTMYRVSLSEIMAARRARAGGRNYIP